MMIMDLKHGIITRTNIFSRWNSIGIFRVRIPLDGICKVRLIPLLMGSKSLLHDDKYLKI